MYVWFIPTLLLGFQARVLGRLLSIGRVATTCVHNGKEDQAAVESKGCWQRGAGGRGIFAYWLFVYWCWRSWIECAGMSLFYFFKPEQLIQFRLKSLNWMACFVLFWPLLFLPFIVFQIVYLVDTFVDRCQGCCTVLCDFICLAFIFKFSHLLLSQCFTDTSTNEQTAIDFSAMTIDVISIEMQEHANDIHRFLQGECETHTQSLSHTTHTHSLSHTPTPWVYIDIDIDEHI